MTSAKPKSMAGQSDAPDDLIAELARLMAEDARADQSGKPQSPVIVRSEPDRAAAPAAVPRFDFSVASSLDRGAPAAPVAAVPAPPPPQKPAPEAPAPFIRIPGEPARTAVAPASATGDFAFDFEISRPAPTPVAPVEPVVAARNAPFEPAPAPVERFEPQLFAEEPRTSLRLPPEADNPPPLDQDSLADLIAAELAASDSNASAYEEPVPYVDGPARGEDTFGVPPVFGMGAPADYEVEPVAELAPPEPVVERAAPVEPVFMAAIQADDEPDSLDEIERLVGPAVHLEPQRQQASSALRSLATPTLPPADNDRVRAPVGPEDADAVDEAIIAAAAATGARIDWVDSANEGDAEVDADLEEDTRRRGPILGMTRAVAGPLVAVGLLLVAGFGLYWVLGQGGEPAGPAPLLVADPAPVKEVPEAAPSTVSQSVVFNEISGGNNGVDEQIVSRDQTGTDVGGGLLSGGTVGDGNEEGLVNRKVRTVVVRPDGTIVSGDDSVAGTSMLPVDRPNVPDVPGADFSTPGLLASAPTAQTATPAATAPVSSIPPVQAGAVVTAVNSAGAVIPGRSVTIPAQRPADFAQIAASALANAASLPQQPAATLPATSPAPLQVNNAATPAVTTSSGGAAAYVQIASQRSEDAARQSAQASVTRYGVLFGGATPEIRRVDLGDRGIYYRVLIPANSRDSAANICTNIKAAGGDCVVQ